MLVPWQVGGHVLLGHRDTAHPNHLALSEVKRARYCLTVSRVRGPPESRAPETVRR
jgi:hypothetical protein